MHSLKKTRLMEFLGTLRARHAVAAPVKRNGVRSFELISDETELDLSGLPEYSAKKFFFPPRELLYGYKVTAKGVEITPAAPPEEELVVFGMRPCDVKAVEVTDRFFLEYGARDPYYAARRKKITVVGIYSAKKGEHFYCDMLGNTFAEGADLILWDAGKHFLVESKTAKGEKLAATARRLLEPTKEKPEPIDCPVNFDRGAVRELPEDDPLWKELGDKCLDCGACTTVCPTCTCFDIVDEPALDGKSGARYRVWASCTTDDFTRVAGGYVFRKDEAARARFRTLHKFDYTTRQYGLISCTGCGRCSRECLTKVAMVDAAIRAGIRKNNAKKNAAGKKPAD
ncbi:MAG: 4Fe-4S dicluster domain-containing protein [Candidatus Micrarchaeota archaeon]|nr:4Fe-4S dicluster domain-containing protein [Candidatus Micrarchaeota archaeon]